MRLISKLGLLVLALILVSVTVVAAPAEHKFVGSEKCKLCHKIQHTSWAASKHAKAFQSLKPAEQKDTKCIGCHVTNNDAAMPGVQCEACHGAGSDYMAMKVMKDKAASVAAGMVVPTKETCVGCHNSKSPTFKGFNYEEQVKKVHDHKPKA